MAHPALDDPACYINRYASWLAFNRRVLEEARSADNPLLERVRFLAISASNLDEFFEVHVAGLLQRLEDGRQEPEADGLALGEQRNLIARQAHRLVQDQYRCWNQELLPALAENRIRILGLAELNPRAAAFVAEYCEREMDPLLTPVTIDRAHPFPRVLNKALCVALLLRRRRRRAAERLLGVITVPRALPRLVRLPGDRDDYVFLSDLVVAHASAMYRGYEILASAAFRVTRNSNLYLQEEESRSVMEAVRSEVLNRRRGAAVRLEIEAGAPAEIVEPLRANFELDAWQVFQHDGPVNLPRLLHLYQQTDRPRLKFAPFQPREAGPAAGAIFAELRRRDWLLHHPFDAYAPVLAFMDAAARDPRVLAIKLTLYRTSDDSPIVRSLLEAAALGKAVTVVVELKARFDEASNIRWARSLQDAGVQVFYGLLGLKTHCKLAVLARRDEDAVVRRYAHLGTGNYNPDTARGYTDLSLLTADPEMTRAADGVFSYLTAYADTGAPPQWAPPRLLAGFWLERIEREAEHARRGRPARIVAKMNGLLDMVLIQALYRAAQAGVQIDLLVRGMCALRPGLAGVSEGIRVRSVVGRFLEHSRIVCFANGGDEEIYLSSGDWMPRNLYERVEAAFPLRDPGLRQRVREEILAAYLADSAKARWLRSDGSYVSLAALPLRERSGVLAAARRLAGGNGRNFNAQEYLLARPEGKAQATASGGRKR